MKATVFILVVLMLGMAALTQTATPPATTATPELRGQKLINPAIYVEEVSSSGGIVASSDSALEAIKKAA